MKVLTVDELIAQLQKIQALPNGGQTPVQINIAEYYEGSCWNATEALVDEIYLNGEWVTGVKFN